MSTSSSCPRADNLVYNTRVNNLVHNTRTDNLIYNTSDHNLVYNPSDHNLIYNPSVHNNCVIYQLFPNVELNLLSPGSGCQLQSGTGHGLPGQAQG